MNTCIYPTPNKFASHSMQNCGSEATVITQTPVKQDGHFEFVPMMLCLKHSIKVAIDKLHNSLIKPYTDEEIARLKEYGYQFHKV